MLSSLEWQVNSCESMQAPHQGVLSPPRSSSCHWWSPCDRCAPHIPQCKCWWSSAICHSSFMATTSAWRRSLIGRASAWPPSSSRHSAMWPSRSPRSSATRSVRASWQARLTPLGGAGFQGEAEPWHRFHSRAAGLHGLCGGRGWKYPKSVSSESGRSTGDRQSHCGNGWRCLRERRLQMQITTESLYETHLQQSRSQVASCLA